MMEEKGEGPAVPVPANDNVPVDHDADIAPWEKIDKVVLSIARLIGRQLAREDFETLRAANDNQLSEGYEQGSGGEPD